MNIYARITFNLKIKLVNYFAAINLTEMDSMGY